MRKLKICLTFSAGGHFTEMKRILPAFERFDCFFATVEASSTTSLRSAYFLKDTFAENRLRVVANLLVVMIQSILILAREKPDVIVSTGADVTIPLCFLGRILGAKVVFVESICRCVDLSAAGKFAYFFVNLFLVQWEDLVLRYPRAKYWGAVL